MNLLKILKCNCRNPNFKKLKNKLICLNCRCDYPVFQGIFNFLGKPSETVSTEIKENKELQKQRQTKSETWLLRLPLAEDFGNTKFEKVNEGYLKNFEWVLDKIDLKGKKILDLGAGTCWTTNKIAQKGADCVAVDISSEKFVGLESAEIYFKHNKLFFERILSDMGDIPFIGESFDVVFTNASLHHATNLKKALSEIKRVLRPGGIFVAINEPCSSLFNFSKKVNPKKARLAGMHAPEGWNEKIYSLYDYWKFLRQNGLKPKFIIPPSVEISLKNLETIQSYKKWLGKAISLIWGYPSTKSLYWIGAFIFGAPLIIIAKNRIKNKGHKAYTLV